MNGPPPAESYVYVICLVRDGHEVGPCKMGLSDKPSERASGLQTSHFEQLKLFRALRMPSRKIARDVEDCFHATHKDDCLRGEWFNIEPQEATSILLVQIMWSLSAFTNLNDKEIETTMRMIEEVA